MNIEIGSVVMALAGREKGSVYVAVGQDGGFVYLADGKERKLEKPKKKSIKHISPVISVIDITGLTNKKLRKLIVNLKPKAQD